jgi:hypothetical protein
MNTKNKMPGFTAENAILKTMTPYRTAGVFDSQTSSAYVRPAYADACLNLQLAFLYARLDSLEEKVSIDAYFAAGCGEE